ALARAPNCRAVPEGLVQSGQGGGSRRTRHVCELPDNRVPAAALPRPPLLQRVPRVTVSVRCVPRPAAEPRREPASPDERARARQAPHWRSRAGNVARLAGTVGLRGRECCMFLFIIAG